MAATALVWTVPVVAAVVALLLVLAWSRTLEGLTSDLVREVRGLRELRRPLSRLRDELDNSDPLVDRVRSHWEK